MRERDVFSGVEKTGKGGHHWVYSPAMDEAGFKKHIVETMLNSLRSSFPEETIEAIKKIS